MLEKTNVVSISGIWEGRVAPVVAREVGKETGPVLVITPTQVAARRLGEDLSFFSSKEVFVLPEPRELLLRYQAKTHYETYEYLRALKLLAQGGDCIVVAPVCAAVKKTLPPSSYGAKAIKLTVGQEVELSQLKKKLVDMGYERLPLVEGKGQFSIRGSIIDVYPPHEDSPYRIELFDTEVDSIRTFQPESQRTSDNVDLVEIYPAELLQDGEGAFERAESSISKAYKTYITRLRNGKSKAEAHQDEDREQDKKREKQIEQLEERLSEMLEMIESRSNLQLLENYIQYFYPEPAFLWDYLPEDGLVVVDDPDRILESLGDKSREYKLDFELLLETGQVIPKDYKNFSGEEEFLRVYKERRCLVTTPYEKRIKGVESLSEIRHVTSKQGPVFGGRMDAFAQSLKAYVQENYRIVIVCASQERLDNLREFIDRSGILGKITLKIGSITGGAEYPEEKLCYIWDGDIFATGKLGRKKNKRYRKNAQAIQSFTDLNAGDFVVHENHGIGKFLGIEQLNVQGIKKDYLKIKYAGQDMLYVPVEQMDLIQKYVSADSATPKINRLSGLEWKKTKARAKAAIANMAKELLDLSAQRKMEPGFAFSEDSIWQQEFEDSFPYQETEDQLRAIREIKKDMEKPEAMDRLLCGDVGYGKTEVAARALFKCVAEGRQAAVLVPTTILANQHYLTLKDRFERFPVKVEMLSRFRDEAQQDEIVTKLRKGQIDLIIGTHRLLSSDVKFKDLGLLVIDEEQRFGVKHKEAIKQLRKNVDVLTMSATPIPRTLHMSLVGIKNMSLIEEPPEERYPVQTYVVEQEDDIMSTAIRREIGRGGQVYVIFNRVQGINRVADMIQDLVPEAVVDVAHGQMNEHLLEDKMMRFIEGQTQVIVATTIIESGIDIPNANTIIILDADRLGLSQLYQLRGRVGRSTRLSYAYLMFKRDKAISEVAEKRLRAIKEFTEFGAGFKVAMRDMEIRGAGNILGMEQHGHMMMIGYELYCKLVDDAVRALQGEIVNPDREETSVELQATAFIPDAYIQDQVLKLQMYKKIASIYSSDDEEEIIDELIDRFGDMPRETLNLIKISRIRAMAEKLCITRVYQEGDKVVCDISPKNPLKPVAYANLSQAYGMRVLIHGGVKPMVRLSLAGGKDPASVLGQTIELLEVMHTEEVS